MCQEYVKLYKEVDLAWAAGLIEGEGCFTIHSKKHPYFLLDMCDKDVLEKFKTIFPFVNLRGPYTNPKRPDNKPRWRVDAFGPKCRHIIIHTYQYFGERRKAQMNNVMSLA